MTTARPTPNTILAAIDYSATSSLVVDQTLELAHGKQPVELHFLHVNQGDPNDDEEQESLRAELHEWLTARLKRGDTVQDTTKVVVHEAAGHAADVIVEMASDLLADAVVVGTHGRRGVQRMVLGSVSEAVVRNCGCPVFVVRPKAHHEALPKIEPPCSRCVETRTRTGGEQLWCEQHGEKHGRRHTYFNTRLSSWVSHRITP
jgi:nucleotide-binding universal stress UspA family protein